MVSILAPLFTECPSHPDWQVDCHGDEGRKARLEAAHNERHHAGVITNEAVADLLYGDPKNTRARDVVEECIRQDAAAHNRHVDSNRVRELVPAWVNPRLTSSVYNVLLRRGTLVPDGETRSTDKRGRNAGRKVNTYRYMGAL